VFRAAVNILGVGSPHDKLTCGRMTKQITRQDLWDLQYRKRPYLRHATEEQLRVRVFEIINNLRTLTIENQIGLLHHQKGGEYWMSRFSHVLEELGLRGHGVLPISDFAHELEGICDKIPDVESRISQHSEAPHLLKFSKREYNEQALLTGHIRISPASSYDDDAKLRAVKDRELLRTTYHVPDGVELVTGEHELVKPVKAIEQITKSPTDYFMYCVSMRYSRRLFNDFRADSCLLIYDVDEFINRLIEAVKRKFSDFAVTGESVMYFDPFDCREVSNVFFMKPFSYAYQSEFRLIWLPPSPVERLEAFFVQIGSLENCAELIG
jgi:hypothetical protein